MEGGQPQKQQQTPQNVRDARSKKRREGEGGILFERIPWGDGDAKGYGVNIAVNMDEIGVGWISRSWSSTVPSLVVMTGGARHSHPRF